MAFQILRQTTLQIRICLSVHACRCIFICVPVCLYARPSTRDVYTLAYLSVCMSVHLYLCLSAHPSVCLSRLPVCPSIYLPAGLSVHLPTDHPSVCSVHRIAYLYAFQSVHPSICLSVCLPACLSACLPIGLSVHLPMCLYVSPSVFVCLLIHQQTCLPAAVVRITVYPSICLLIPLPTG